MLIESWVRVGSLDQFISVSGAFTVGVSVAGRISDTHHSESWTPESNGAWTAFDIASHSAFAQRNNNLESSSLDQEMRQALWVLW